MTNYCELFLFIVIYVPKYFNNILIYLTYFVDGLIFFNTHLKIKKKYGTCATFSIKGDINTILPVKKKINVQYNKKHNKQ